MTDYPNWFACYADDFCARHLSHLAGKPGLRFLQIGAFTGDASVWLLDNILTGEGSLLVDVDTWTGSDEPIHKAFDWADVQRVYQERTHRARCDRRIQTIRGPSDEFQAGNGYDFAYVDGDHRAASVLLDGVKAYQGLKVGGLLAFDDYEWSSGKGEAHDPRPAIDVFVNLFAARLELLELGAQAWFRKIA